MTVVVTGGAGFVGSHVVEELLIRGYRVHVVDNQSTGNWGNLLPSPQKVELIKRLSVQQADATEPALTTWGLPAPSVEGVFHLASPASVRWYREMPVETMRVNSEGTLQAARLAQHFGCRLVYASTSEVYGDPLMHPQSEDYWGNVNPCGERSVYDEAKRYGEALLEALRRYEGLDAAWARIFNCYGPRLRPEDGRVIPRFLEMAMREEPLTVYGDGSQTRSFCYVTDTARGLVDLFESNLMGPVNIGNPHEVTVGELVNVVAQVVGRPLGVQHTDPLEDDPRQRCPDIGRAWAHLGWKPEVSLLDGVRLTHDWLKAQGYGPALTRQH